MSSLKAVRKIIGTRIGYWFLILVIVVNFGYALAHQIKPAVDARAYDTIAQNDEVIFKVRPGLSFLADFIAA